MGTLLNITPFDDWLSRPSRFIEKMASAPDYVSRVGMRARQRAEGRGKRSLVLPAIWMRSGYRLWGDTVGTVALGRVSCR